MAKFATALCILLVAYSAQGFSFSVTSSVSSAIISQLEDDLSEIQAQLVTLAEDFATVENKTEAYVLNATTYVEKWIAEQDAKYEELKAEAGDAASCISSSVNYTAEAEELLTDAIACAEKVLANIQSDYEAVVADFKTLSSDFTTTLASAEACRNLLCEAQVTKEAAELALRNTVVIADGATLVADISQIRNKFLACGFESALETITSNWQTDLSEIETCIKEATETESTTSAS